MLLKAKCAQQTVLREIQKDQLNEASRMKKLKDPKKKIQIGVPNISSITPVGLKRLHRPSKSTLEPQQHPHYNSPSNPLSQNQNLQINTFSFTNILQQNMKNKHSQQSINSLQQQRSSNVQIMDSKLSAHALSRDHDARISQKNNKNHKKESISKEYSMNMRDLSYAKINSSKSPSRMINKDRINNTPKLKQQTKIEKDERTFRELLDHKQNSAIRLQCSQKLFKFIQNDASIGQLYPKSIYLPHSSDKSNLLSTGVISMSQRYQNNKYSMQLMKNSKENISGGESVLQNEETKQFFPQDSSSLCSEGTLQDRILKVRSRLISSKIQTKFSSQSNSLKNIEPLFYTDQSNTQSKQPKHTETITKLVTLKMNLLQNVKYIISHLEKLSYSFITHIEDQISRLREMDNTQIDWFKIQTELENNHKLLLQQCESEALLMRIQALEIQIIRKKQCDQSNRMFFEVELSKIEQKTSNLISKKQQQSSLSCKKSLAINQSLADIQSQLKKLWCNLEQALLLRKSPQ